MIKFSSSSLTPASSSALVDCIAGDLTIGTIASGANYTITNGMLFAEGTATIAVSDIINHLENTGDLVINACGGDLFVNTSISANLPTSRVLSLRAEGDIVVDDDIAIAATGSALNLVFWSDLNGDEQGGVLFRAGSSIQSNNGHIWIGGGAGSTTWNDLAVGNSYAVGLSNTLTGITTTYSGINAVCNAINAGSGDLYLSGKSTQTDYRFGIGIRIIRSGDPMAINGRNITILGIGSENANSIGQDFNRGNWGVGIENTAIVASGAITIEGTGGGQNLTSSISNGGGNYGVRIDNTSSVIATGSGNISITGTGGSPSGTSNTDNDGLRIDGGIIRVNSGTLTLLGTAGTNNNSEDIQYSAGTSESRNPSNTLATGAIEIKANTLTIASGVRFRTNGGDFLIQPRTPATTIGIAGATGTLSLLSSYFSTNFESGFNTISIGSAVQTGNIACNTVTFRDHTTLQTSGSLTFGGNVTTNADKNLTLINNDLSFNSSRIFNIGGAFAYIPFGANFTSDVTFPMTNLTLSSTIKGLTIGKSGNDKNITVNAAVNGNQDVRLFGNEIQLNENIDCGNIVLEGSTTLTAGKYINTGNLTHNGNITLNADASSGAYSQLRFMGSYAAQAGNTISQEKRLTGGWHNIAVPVTGDAGMLGEVGTNRHPNAQNLRYWDADAGNWVNVVDNAAPLISGRGYNAFVGPSGVQTATGIITATGAPITSVNPIVEFNINPPAWVDFVDGVEDGWNLVANPFCATLDFTTLTGRTNNVDNSFHIWNPAGDAYVSWANAAPADGVIPPMQSFWVRATDPMGPSLGTLTYANTTVSATPSFRKTESISDHVLLRVSEVAQLENADVLTFALTYDNATDGFDNDWDARKMMNPGATPSLYSLGGGVATSINAIPYGPAEVNSKMIPLGMRVQSPNSTAFSIALDDTYLNNHYDIYLEDSKENVFHNLKEGVYRFAYDADAPYRFKLHFGTQGVAIEEGTAAVSAWVYGDGVFIRSNNYEGPMHWLIMDVNGREVQRGSADTPLAIGTTQRFVLPDLSSGIYLLQIVTKNGVQQVKFQQ